MSARTQAEQRAKTLQDVYDEAHKANVRAALVLEHMHYGKCIACKPSGKRDRLKWLKRIARGVIR